MKQVIEEFVTAAISNPRVNYTRNGKFKMDERSIARVKTEALKFMSSGLGGPRSYSGKSLVEIHRGMEITDGEFSAIASDFKLALEKHAIPASLVTTTIEMVERIRGSIVEVP